MLLKKAVDWNDLDIKQSRLTKSDWYVLIGVILFLIVAGAGLFYLVKHWYGN